jgi:ATP-dependent RNA helicase RhlE
MDFKDLNISQRILDALEKENYKQPTPIQEQAIPPVLEGRDLLGCAQTGTGKTAAFAVPILQLLSKQTAERTEPRRIRSLILTPTRELALQIYESFHAYGRYTRLHACVIFGGVSQKMQVEKLIRGVDILVATPGRLNDLMNQGYINLDHVKIFVLDEADRMLDMGFIADVKKIVAKIPRQKQTLLFSATMPPEIEEMVNNILVDPVKVTITPPATTVEAITQSVYFVDKGNKAKLLIHLLNNPEIRSALVFTRTKHGADRVVKELEKAKISAQSIHGNKSQLARQTALGSFKNGTIRVLVATDIAARGIDIEELSCVFNYDLPEVPETYVHRIGRTGRAGMSGIAVSFCCIDEKNDLKNIQKLIGKTIPVVEDHPFPMLITTPTPKSELRRRRPPMGAAEFSRKEQPKKNSAGREFPKKEPVQKDGFKKDSRKTEIKPEKPYVFKKDSQKSRFSKSKKTKAPYGRRG